MTYCVGMLLRDGLIMVSDTRTNAGVDHISTYRKMTVWQKPGDRVIALMTAGNLSVSQSVVNLLNEALPEDGSDPPDDPNAPDNIMTAPSMFRVARLVGEAVRQVRTNEKPTQLADDSSFSVSLMLGGQVQGRTLRMFHIYDAGNFIEASEDTPYFQLGEHKYGKPLLDRAITFQTGLGDGLKVALISMDSTMRSNMTVGMPLDVAVIRRDQPEVALQHRIEPGDPYFNDIRERWSQALRHAYTILPDADWATLD